MRIIQSNRLKPSDLLGVEWFTVEAGLNLTKEIQIGLHLTVNPSPPFIRDLFVIAVVESCATKAAHTFDI